eukprot:2168873-Amphidinium_carterae.1
MFSGENRSILGDCSCAMDASRARQLCRKEGHAKFQAKDDQLSDYRMRFSKTSFVVCKIWFEEDAIDVLM